MERERRGRLSDCSALGTSGGGDMTGGNASRQSLLTAPMLVVPGADAYRSDDEIERPRLEDSRTSLVLQLPPDLAMLLPSHRHLRPQDPLLSSTMVQDAAVQDWPNASSIRLGNSNSGQWGGNNSVSIMEDSLSDPLNNAGICLDVSSPDADVALSADIDAPASAAAPAAPAAPAAADAASEALASVSGFDTDSSGPSCASSVTSNHEVSSPRLRVLASDGEQHRRDEEPHHHQQQPPQLALGLLQVCRLTLDVLSEGGLLRDEAHTWLTPELLCDKLCDRIYCPVQPLITAAAAAAAAAPPSADSSIVAPAEFESPAGRVRHWLLADGEDAALLRQVTNSV